METQELIGLLLHEQTEEGGSAVALYDAREVEAYHRVLAPAAMHLGARVLKALDPEAFLDGDEFPTNLHTLLMKGPARLRLFHHELDRLRGRSWRLFESRLGFDEHGHLIATATLDGAVISPPFHGGALWPPKRALDLTRSFLAEDGRGRLGLVARAAVQPALDQARSHPEGMVVLKEPVPLRPLDDEMPERWIEGVYVVLGEVGLMALGPKGSETWFLDAVFAAPTEIGIPDVPWQESA